MNELQQVCLEAFAENPTGPITGVRASNRCPSDRSPLR